MLAGAIGLVCFSMLSSFRLAGSPVLVVTLLFGVNLSVASPGELVTMTGTGTGTGVVTGCLLMDRHAHLNCSVTLVNSHLISLFVCCIDLIFTTGEHVTNFLFIRM